MSDRISKLLFPKFLLVGLVILSPAFIISVFGSTPSARAIDVDKAAQDFCKEEYDPLNDNDEYKGCMFGFKAGYNGQKESEVSSCLPPFIVSVINACKAGHAAGKGEKESESAKSGDSAIYLTRQDAADIGINPTDDTKLLPGILNGVYTIVAIVAVIIIIAAGFMYITSEGDANKIAAARKAIIYALVGLVIVGSAFIITGIVQGIGTNP